jgi:hypothetical protein
LLIASNEPVAASRPRRFQEQATVISLRHDPSPRSNRLAL